MEYSERKLIDDMAKELTDKYPNEANYCSRCSLWSRGLDDNLVTAELYIKARKYYGNLWTYTGD